MKLTLFGPSRFHDAAKQASAGRLTNCYREAVSGRSAHVLRSVLGLVQFSELEQVFLRAIQQIDGTLYAAAGGVLYSVASSGTVTNLGNITDASDTVIDGNNGRVTVTAGGKYYVWNGTTLSEPTAGAFSSFGSHSFLSNFTLLTQKGGRQIQISDANDPTTLGALNYVEAELIDSDIVRAVAINGAYWVFKETGIEVFAFNTAGDLIPYQGMTFETGLKSFRYITKIPNGAAFVGDDNALYLVGQGPVPVSTSAIEEKIENYDLTDVFYFEDRGHKMIALRFSDAVTDIYDLSMKEWHERAEGVDLDPWSALVAAEAYGKWIVGTNTGVLSQLGRINADLGETMRRRAVGSVDFGGKQRLARVEARGEMGAFSSGHAFDDDVTLTARFSRDFGRSWTEEKPRSMGALGDTRQKAVWRSQGQYEALTMEINLTDAVDVSVDCDVLLEVV